MAVVIFKDMMQRTVFLFFLLFLFYFAQTNNYSTLHLQFITGNVIVYKKEIKRQRKTKSTKKYL